MGKKMVSFTFQRFAWGMLLFGAPSILCAQGPGRSGFFPSAGVPPRISSQSAVHPPMSAAHAPSAPAPVGSPAFSTGYRPFSLGTNSANSGAFLNSGGYRSLQSGAYRSLRPTGRRDRRPLPPVFFSTPYYYPYVDYGPGYYGSGYNGSGYDYPPDDFAAQNADLTANLLGEQLRRLSIQMEQLRNEQQAQLPPQAQQQQQPDPLPPANPITVVLRDGRQLQTASYAVMNGELWDFSQQPARRTPLANIDIAASQKASEEAGAEFPLTRAQ